MIWVKNGNKLRSETCPRSKSVSPVKMCLRSKSGFQVSCSQVKKCLMSKSGSKSNSGFSGQKVGQLKKVGPWSKSGSHINQGLQVKSKSKE